MRAFLIFVGALVGVLSFSIAAGASTQEDPQQIVEETLESLDLKLAEGLLGGSESAKSDSASPSSYAPSSTASYGPLLGPLVGLGQGVTDLGFNLIGAMFAGFSMGASSFAQAAETVASAPVESGLIATAILGSLGLFSLLALAATYGSLGSIPLFSRIGKNELLDNPIRASIYELIQQNPGINVSQISQRLNVAWGTATHHLQKLRQERFVGIRIQNHEKCYFPNGGTYTPREMDVMSATKHVTTRRVAEFLAANGPATHQTVSQSLGLSPALVSFHLQKLERAGIVNRRREGRSTILEPLETNLSPAPRPSSHAF